MRTSEQGFALIKTFEGCELTAYRDCRGVWTIGYGWTQPVNGVAVGAGLSITRSVAGKLLTSGIAQYEQAVNRLVRAPLNQQQFDALVDFTYNLGVDALAGSTLLKKLNARDYAGAADEMLRWNEAGGKALADLTHRRAAEREMFLS